MHARRWAGWNFHLPSPSFSSSPARLAPNLRTPLLHPAQRDRRSPDRSQPTEQRMLRACTRLVPSLAPRAEAALGTRGMGLAGMKGACRAEGWGGVRVESLGQRVPAAADPLSPCAGCRLRRPGGRRGGTRRAGCRAASGGGRWRQVPPCRLPGPPVRKCLRYHASASLLQMLYFKKVCGSVDGVASCGGDAGQGRRAAVVAPPAASCRQAARQRSLMQGGAGQQGICGAAVGSGARADSWRRHLALVRIR